MGRGGARTGAGAIKGSKHFATIQREVAYKNYSQLVLEKLKPLFQHQWSLVKGTSYLYRIEETKMGKEHVLVEDPDEIGRILEQMDEGESGMYTNPKGNEKFYYITTRAPESRAIDSMLDRVFGKAKNTTDVNIREAPRPILAAQQGTKNGLPVYDSNTEALEAPKEN